MTDFEKKLMYWSPFPVVWGILWWMVAYHHQAELAEPNPTSVELSQLRCFFVFALTVSISFSRHLLFGTRSPEILFRNREPGESILSRSVTFLPEILTALLFLTISWSISQIASSLFSFWILLGYFAIFEVPFYMGKTKANQENTDTIPSAFLAQQPSDQVEEPGSQSPNQKTEQITTSQISSDLPNTGSIREPESNSEVDSGQEDLSNEALLAGLMNQEDEAVEGPEEEGDEQWTSRLTITQKEHQTQQQWIWVYDWADSERDSALHMCFCPFFQKVPQIDLQIADGLGEAKIVQTTVQGCQVSLSRTVAQAGTGPTTIILTANSTENSP